MKRPLSFLLILTLILVCVTLSSCGDRKTDERRTDITKTEEPDNEMMTFVDIGEIDSVDDKETSQLLDSLRSYPDLLAGDYICILTEKAQGDIKIPNRYQGSFVTAVTAYPGECAGITSIAFGGAVLHIDQICSFDSDDPTLESIKFDKSAKISVCNSFNHCSSLKEVGFSMQNKGDHSGAVQNSFNSCKSLQKVELAGEIASVSGSFNDCASLEDVVLRFKPHEINDSFSNCPVKIGDVMPKYETPEEEEEGKAKEEAEEEAQKPAAHIGELQKTIDEAWEKLADSGAIPEYSRDENGKGNLKFVSGGSIDILAFDDKSVRERLLAEPDYALDQVIVMTYKEVPDQNAFKEKSAEYYDDCRYIIVYEGFDSDFAGILISQQNTDSRSAYDVTTLVYVIDAESKEILTIHTIGTDRYTYDHKAKVLSQDALSFIYYKLLK